MTAPIAPTRPAVDPATAIAPNAQTVPAGSPHDADASAAAEFGAALSLMLGHVTKAATGSLELKIGSPDHEHTTSDATDESADAPSADTSGGTVVADAGGPHPAAHADAGPATAPNAPSPAEIAADAALGDVAHQSLVAALANPITASAPAIALPPLAIVAADARTVTRSLDLLAPEFRDRLERVIARMESEFGYKVEVTETFRSQARQNTLFAQGRTEPGQVVTWTRASNHTAGRAADLVIDGSYDNPLAYDRLMRVAREEGLRTLGPRDPGHLELPSSPSLPSIDPRLAELEHPAAPAVPASAGGLPSPNVLVEPEPVGPPTSVPGVARVAGVAPVAVVAKVAEVAQVATVGAQATPVVHAAPRVRASDAEESRGGARRVIEPDGGSGPPGTGTALGGVAASSRSSDTGADSSGGRGHARPNDDRRRPDGVDATAARNGAVEVLRQSRDELMHAVAGSDPTARAQATSRDASSPILGHADMSERIARLLKVQDAANERPLSQVTLRLDRPDGGADRLRVDLRGNTVSATLDVSDPAAADRLGANVKELQRSLERQGLQTDSVTVRTMTRALESSTLSRAAGASLESDLQRTAGSASTSSTNTSSRERGARHDEQRPSPDSQRQRSRREQKGDR